MHVDCFGALLFDDPIGKDLGGGIVDFRWGKQLRVTHFRESGVNGHVFLAIDISGSDFGFGRRAHHIAHDFGHGEKRAVGVGGEDAGFERLGERKLRK